MFVHARRPAEVGEISRAEERYMVGGEATRAAAA